MDSLPENHRPQVSAVVSVMGRNLENENEPPILNILLDQQQKTLTGLLPQVQEAGPDLLQALTNVNHLGPDQGTTTTDLLRQVGIGSLTQGNQSFTENYQFHQDLSQAQVQTQVQHQSQDALAAPAASQHDLVMTQIQLQAEGQGSNAAAVTYPHDPVLTQAQLQGQGQWSIATAETYHHDPVLTQVQIQGQGQGSTVAAETYHHCPVPHQIQDQTQIQTQTSESCVTTTAGPPQHDLVLTQVQLQAQGQGSNAAAMTYSHDPVPGSNLIPEWFNNVDANDLYKKMEDFMDNGGLPFQCAQPVVTFTIPEYKKNKKREKVTHRVYKNLVTINPNTPLPVHLSGIKANQEVEVTCRFKGLHRQQEPVLNPKARNEEEDPTKCKFFFDVMSHRCRYELVDEHPTAIFPVEYRTLEKNSAAVNFALEFLCHNSDLKGQCTRLELVLRLVETEEGRRVAKEERFLLEVRGNIDRDHFDLIKHLFPQEIQADQGLNCEEAKAPYTIKQEPMDGASKRICKATTKQVVTKDTKAGDTTASQQVTTVYEDTGANEATVGGEAMTPIVTTMSGQVAVEDVGTRGMFRKRRTESKHNVGEGSETVDPSPKRTRSQEPTKPTSRDEWAAFGECVTLRLRGLNDNKKRREARHKIETVLYEFEEDE